MKRWQASRRSFQQRRLGAPGEMRRLFESGSATEPRSAELLGEPKRAEAEEQAVVRRDVESVDAQLSVVQQAMPRLFEIRVQQRLREILERQRQQAGLGPRRRSPTELP